MGPSVWLISADVPHTLNREVWLAVGNVLEMPARSSQGRGVLWALQTVAFCLLSLPIPEQVRVSPRPAAGLSASPCGCQLLPRLSRSSGAVVLLPNGPAHPYVTAPSSLAVFRGLKSTFPDNSIAVEAPLGGVSPFNR